MLVTDASLPVYLAVGSTDMRKSIDGLAAIVAHCFELDPFSWALFVFCSKRRDRVKILYWEHNGFWLMYKRLEKGRFRWPDGASEPTIRISRRELSWLLDGLTIVQRQAHKPVTARIAA